MRINDVGRPGKNSIEQKIGLLPKNKKMSAKWEMDKNKKLRCCTMCGGVVPLRYFNGFFQYREFMSPYCPHCGEKMENGEKAVDE